LGGSREIKGNSSNLATLMEKGNACTKSKYDGSAKGLAFVWRAKVGGPLGRVPLEKRSSVEWGYPTRKMS